MGFPINGDLVPSVSGFANLGINVSSNGRNAFDITTLRPFGSIHVVSGIFHDPVQGQSGVMRYSRAAAAFQVSVDGGLTFNDLSAGGGVSSVGVIGDTNLTGNVDFATRPSGFMVIEDTADASPLLWAVNTLGLSGLWAFPTQGFNGRVVNALTDFNGTEAQGVISVVGASGIVVDIVGQVMTITPGSATPRCFAASFVSATSWTVSHNLGTIDVQIEVFDDQSPRQVILPDSIFTTDTNTVTVNFNSAQAGRCVIVAC